MGLFNRFRANKEETAKAEPAKVEAAVSNEIYHVIFRCPPYFKQESGEYHVFIDGEEHVCLPLQSFETDLSGGRHSLRVYSTPETLDDMTQDIEVVKNMTVSITVNVLKRCIKLADNNPNNH